MSDKPSVYDSIFAGSLFDPSTPLISADGLSFVNRSSLVLNYIAPKGFFMVASNENSVNPGGAGTIKVALSSTTLLYYNDVCFYINNDIPCLLTSIFFVEKINHLAPCHLLRYRPK